MNKFNIDEYVFFTETDFIEPETVKITMGQVEIIERYYGDSGHNQIIYTVKPLYAVNHEKHRWKGKIRMDEGALSKSFVELLCRTKKVRHNYFELSIEEKEAAIEEKIKSLKNA